MDKPTQTTRRRPEQRAQLLGVLLLTSVIGFFVAFGVNAGVLAVCLCCIAYAVGVFDAAAGIWMRPQRCHQ